MMRLAAALWIVVSLSSPAQAQAPAEQEFGPAEQEARARFQLARAHFAQGRFEEAAREFEAAYALAPHAGLLFNAYVAWRDAGVNDRAADALERYLAEIPPDHSDRPMLEARLATLRQAAAAREAPAEPASDAVGPSIAPWIVMGAGAALGVAATITGVVALDMHGQLEDRCSGGVCAPDDAGDVDTGRALAITTDVLWVTGAIVGAAGLVWGIVDLVSSGSQDEAPVTASCGPTGCAVRGVF